MSGDELHQFTRDTVASIKGSWARKAEDVFKRHDTIQTVLFGDQSVTDFCHYNGYVKNHGMKPTVMYIRKSSGGKWGRSVQYHLLVTREQYDAADVLRKLGVSV